MKTVDDIESYLIHMGVQYDAVKNGMWVIKDVGPELVISIANGVCVFRLKVMETERVPRERREDLYRALLELNAAEMMHGAYGLEAGSVVVTDALQLENLDFNEFQATVDDMGLAVTNHYGRLSQFVA